MITIQVFRFNPETDVEPRYETYEVPAGPGIMVLDALNYIREHYDPTLRFRHSCHMGKCGSCSLTADGKACLACWEPVQDHMVIEPLPGFPLIADLVVERPPDQGGAEKLEYHVGETGSSAAPEPLQCKVPSRQELDEIRKCIHCYACLSACPYIHVEKTRFIGPEPMLETARHVLDPRTDETQSLEAAIGFGVWDCVSCRACTVVCPQEIDARGRILDLRDRLMDRPELKGIPNTTIQLNERLMKSGTPYGVKSGRPGLWREGLNLTAFSVEHRPDFLFFPGCTLNSDEAGRQTAANLIALLRAGGVDFGVLPEREVCCGDPAKVSGEIDLFDLLKDQNSQLFREYGVHRLATACPHGQDLFNRFYPAGPVKAFHYLELLADAIRRDRLRFNQRLNAGVTYHDPCYLGRYQGIYEDPRHVLRSIPGLKLLEMENHGPNSLCCGGGGGGAFVEMDAEPRLSWVRARQAVDTGAEILAVACPFCFTMLDDAARSMGLALQIRHIADLAMAAL